MDPSTSQDRPSDGGCSADRGEGVANSSRLILVGGAMRILVSITGEFDLYRQNTPMQQSLSAMQTALRVLTAITYGRQPDPADVADLHSYAGPQPAGIGLDEFACEVVQKAIRHRTEVRGTGRGLD